MNIVQVFTGLALFAVSYVSAELLPITLVSPAAGSVLVSDINFQLEFSASPNTTYNAVFTDAFGHSVSAIDLPTGEPQTINPIGLIGAVSLNVTVNSQLYSNPDLISYTVVLPSLVIAPIDSVMYGQAVPLLVNTNGTSGIHYTASFSCTSGSYQITGLTTGVLYNLVPAGIYGNVVVTVTATNANPGMSAFAITQASANIPPAFIPGRLPYYPSVYANMKDGKDLEIVEIKHLDSLMH